MSAISAYLELMAAEASQRLTPPRLDELRQIEMRHYEYRKAHYDRRHAVDAMPFC